MVHSPGLPAAGMILLLGALVGIFIASCPVEVSWMSASVSRELLRWCKRLLYIPPQEQGGIKGFRGGPLGLPRRTFGKVCRDNELTNGHATESAKLGYSGQCQHLTCWPILIWVVLNLPLQLSCHLFVIKHTSWKPIAVQECGHPVWNRDFT